MTADSPLEIRFSLRTRLRPASDATEKAHLRRVGRLPRVTLVLALVIHLETMIRRGEAKDYADLARLSCLCRERISYLPASRNSVNGWLKISLMFYKTRR
jgi:hypothetical protein